MSNKNAPATNGNESAPDKCDYKQGDDLFPESLEQVAQESKDASRTPPIVSGQCALVLYLIREHGPILSFELTANRAIPEAAARVHDSRAAGFNVQTTILAEVEFRGMVRRKAALYSIGIPEWPAPGFLPQGRSA